MTQLVLGKKENVIRTIQRIENYAWLYNLNLNKFPIYVLVHIKKHCRVCNEFER